MNHKMTDMTSNHKPATGVVFVKVSLVLLAGIVMILAVAYPSNVRSFTNPINSNTYASAVNNDNNSNTISHNNNCKGEECQTLVCINNDCHSNSKSDNRS